MEATLDTTTLEEASVATVASVAMEAVVMEAVVMEAAVEGPLGRENKRTSVDRSRCWRSGCRVYQGLSEKTISSLGRPTDNPTVSLASVPALTSTLGGCRGSRPGQVGRSNIISPGRLDRCISRGSVRPETVGRHSHRYGGGIPQSRVDQRTPGTVDSHSPIIILLQLEWWQSGSRGA